MKKLIAIGEALIDFIPSESKKQIKNVENFRPSVGGAPANVCCAFTKLGGDSEMITQLGMDPFGDKIIDEFIKYGIGCDYISRTEKANTSLAFVALKEDGNREFSFYRNPGADMLLSEDKIKPEWFKDCYALHFCSVSLGDFPMKEAHKKAIEYAKNEAAIISFDPNLRPALWKNKNDMKKTVLEFLPMADIVKISDEELLTITGTDEIDAAIPILFKNNVKLVIYTKGEKGAEAYTKRTKVSCPGIKVKAIDTTGAGDGFIGSFLYFMMKNNINKQKIEFIDEILLKEILQKSNAFCSESVQKKGAMASYPEKI